MAKTKPRRLTRSARRRRAKPTHRGRRARRTGRKKSRKAMRRPARGPGAARRSAARRTAPKRTAPKRAAPKRGARPRKRAVAAAPPRTPVGLTTLARERRRLPDAERLDSNRLDPQLASSVRAGRNELRHRLAEHTESDPSLTAGDVDAKWDDAYAVGDEAPGGDNPTPDQDRVDDIGHALGVEYQANEELKSSDKIAKRDHHRWELDPASSEDWPRDRKEE